MVLLLVILYIGWLWAREASYALPMGWWYAAGLTVFGVLLMPFAGLITGTALGEILNSFPAVRDHIAPGEFVSSGVVIGGLAAILFPVETWYYRKKRAIELGLIKAGDLSFNEVISYKKAKPERGGGAGEKRHWWKVAAMASIAWGGISILITMGGDCGSSGSCDSVLSLSFIAGLLIIWPVAITLRYFVSVRLLGRQSGQAG